ncbi:hypothetical protein JCM24511_04730 [Saitozyma sp. JCM 24511]|nr:hypothetical protein JCM24511_04730 [Saitozyma sp. JCM 24511]
MPDFVPHTAGTSHAAIIQGTKPALINWVAAIFAAIGTFLFGYDSGIISSVISTSYDEFQDYFGHPGAGITGAIVSVFAGGAFFGALLAGYTADKIGRKRTIQLGALIAIIGEWQRHVPRCAIQAGAANAGMLIAGRAIAGLAIGVLSMIVPMYQAEISPPHVRGLMSGWTQMMISWGFFVANWIGYGCQFIHNQGQWRIPLAIQIIPAIFLLFGMFLLPYSPRWLAKQGRPDEAKAALIRLHGGANRARTDVVEAEFAEMEMQIEWERENLSTNFKDLFNTRPNLHRTVCGVLVQAMTQWTGVNVNNYYGPTIYNGLGYTGNTVLMIQGIYGAWGVVCTWTFITFIVDRLGRRRPLIIGSALLACCLAWQAGCSSAFATPGYSNSHTGIAGIASIFMFSWVFSWSFGPVSWIYQSEIFPTNLRALGTSASTASNWLNNVLISQITPYGFDHISWRYFFVYMACNLSNCVVSYFLFPETKNKTLEEIGLLFGDTNVRVAPTDDAATLTDKDGRKGEHRHLEAGQSENHHTHNNEHEYGHEHGGQAVLQQV